MSTPVFNQVNANVYALSTLSGTGLSGYWAGYFAGPASQLGASASTTAVWQDTGGCYLILDQQPSDWPTFINSLNTLLPRLGPPGTLRFLWISRAAGPVSQWSLTPGFATAGGSGNNIAWTLLRSFAFGQGAYQLSINGQSALTYIPDANGGGIAFPGGGSFTGPEGGYLFANANISFSGAALGAFQAVITAPVPANPSLNDLWTSLRIGLQYAGTPAASPPDQVPAGELDPRRYFEGATHILFMPVFQRQQAPLTLALSFDPMNPFVSSRTVLDMFPAGNPPPQTLETWFRTTKGYPVTLKPLAATGTVPNARFVMGYCPVREDTPEEGLCCHFSPDGAFQALTNAAAAKADLTVPDQLLLGLSGLEYTSIGSGSTQVFFLGGQPAYIPAEQKDESVAPDVSKALTNSATTSHLNILALPSNGTAPVYYAQPKEAPIFSGKDANPDGKLDFNPMPAFTLQNQPAVFPVGVYAGLSAGDAPLARAFENASLAPYRNYAIGKAYGVTAEIPDAGIYPDPQRRQRLDTDPLGVTPQGLVAELTADYTAFDGLILGNMPNTSYPSVDLTVVTGLFKQSLQSNQLFFVSRNADVLMSGTSIRYQLTEKDKPFLLAMGVPQTVINAVYQAVSGATQPFDTEGAFKTCIATAAGTWLSNFLTIAGILKVEMDGWTFQLSPRSWRTDPTTPTLMIAKFCKRSLLELAQDSSSWAWPQSAIAASGTLGDTQTVLLQLLTAAGEPKATPGLQVFYNTVVTNANWNGFLFLNAPVDIAEMPEELKFLTAGIDTSKFCAHHIGFSQTPFTAPNGVPQLQQTAAFGLIDYEDPLDLYAEKTIPFGFKTTRLHVRFANAGLVEFSAEVELMLNGLLAASLAKKQTDRGNNLVMTGSYQRVGGVPCYIFTLTGENIYNAFYTPLTQIEVLSVRLTTGGVGQGADILTTFTLTGNLRFFIIETFDMFSYGPDATGTDGYLRFSGLSIAMRFSQATPTVQVFTVNTENMAFDLSNSIRRPSSLVNNFPLQLSGLLCGPNLAAADKEPSGQTPEDLGYTSISAPFEQQPMVPTWYGLVFTLDMGNFGALSGSVPFRISVLAAWSRGSGDTDHPIYIGLKLPGISAIAGSLPLQGVLKLGFRSFRFETYPADLNQTGYLLRMRQFALSVLVWSFPPGNNEIVLFGQPGNPTGSLGWYAAYNDGDDKKPPMGAANPISDDVRRRLQSGRRTPPVG